MSDTSCGRCDRALDLLHRIAASIEDGTIDTPDVEGAILDEIDELLEDA